MSEEKIELLRRLMDAYNRGDYIAATERVHPDVELVTPIRRVIGIERLREWMKPDAFAKQKGELREVTVVDDGLLVHSHVSATGAGSGIDMEIDAWSIWSFDDAGLITRVVYFLDREQAVKAAGLSE
jgi:ketosteroid isomerase-like protein